MHTKYIQHFSTSMQSTGYQSRFSNIEHIFQWILRSANLPCSFQDEDKIVYGQQTAITHS